MKYNLLKLSDKKLKEGIFTGEQIHLIIKKQHGIILSLESITFDEQFVNSKQQNWLLKNSLPPFPFLFSLPSNLRAVDDEQGKQFHQDVKTLEERFQGCWVGAMMGAYFWLLKREDISCI